MFMDNIPKKIALTVLPDSLLHAIKRIHYLWSLRSITEDDEPDLRVLRYLVAPGQWVADVGANIGVYTKYLSERTGPSGRVCSVEPIPLTFDILRSNVQKLRLKNVELKNYAISDVEGHVTMRVPKHESGGENYYAAHIEGREVSNSLRSFVVPSTTIDSLFSEQSPPIHFIKCDVEGHELHCIKGAAHTIQNSRPAWLIEISSNMDDDKSDSYRALQILQENGYEVYWFDGTTLRRRQRGDKSVNYFFLRPEHLQVLREGALPIEVW
jgi:FkbM family methyltransferase